MCVNTFLNFYALLTVHPSIIIVNKKLDAQISFMYVCFYSLHVSGNHVLINSTINCINAIPAICQPQKSE